MEASRAFLIICWSSAPVMQPAINRSSLDDLALFFITQDRKTSDKLIWLSFAYSRWICSRCGCGNGAGDSAGGYIPGCDSTQGEVFSESTASETMDHITVCLCCLVGACSLWFGLLSHAFRPREEAHPGTLAGLFCCSTRCHHRHLLHITGSM